MQRKKVLSLVIIFIVLIMLSSSVYAAIVTTGKVTSGPATVGNGTVVSGSADSTRVDDGTYYAIDEGNGSQLSVQFNSWEQFTEANDTAVTKMEIVLNGKASTTDDTYYVYLWDYNSGNWTASPVGNFGQLGSSDTTATVSVTTNITRYIDPSGNFRVMIKCSKAAGYSESLKFDVLSIDLLRVDFTYDNGVNDTTPPQVSGTTPADGAVDVAVTTTVRAAFDEDLTASTVNTNTFKLWDGTGYVTGSVSYDSGAREAVFTPGTSLSYSKTYTATVTTGIQDLAGNSLQSNYTWTFTTVAEGVDVTPPSVTGTTPPNGTTGVSTYTSVEAVFSENMDPATITGATFYLKQGSTDIPAAVSYDNTSRTAVLVPDSNLAYSTTYTATITTGVRDLAGNPMSTNYSWSFTTAAAPSSPPSTPTNVLAEGIGSMEIAINWVPVDQAEGYKVYRSTSSGSGFIQVGQTVGQLETYYVDNDLNQGTAGVQPLPASTRYYYKVSAYNSQGESGMSINYSHTYTDENGQNVTRELNRGKTFYPRSPRGVLLTAGPNRVTISWTANPESNIQGYNVYRAEESGAEKGDGLVKLNSSVITGTSYTDLTTANYYDYYYRVSAVDDTGAEGHLSAERFIRIEDSPPAYVPHKDFSSDSSPCATCHVTHAAIGAKLIPAATEPELCFSCHDGTGSQNITYQEFTYSHYISRHPVPAGGNPGTMDCSDCHNAHLDYLAVDGGGNKLFPKIMEQTYNGIKYYKGNELCYTCHGVGSAYKGGDHETAFEGSVHNTAMPNPASGTENRCINCHEPHAAPNENLKRYSEEQACFACHYPDTIAPGAPDIYARITASPSPDTHHDVLDEDQAVNGSKIECQNCHNPHGLTAVYKLTDPDNPAPGVLWTETAEPTEAQPKSGTINEFCLRCHDGTYTGNGTVAPYAPSVTPGTENLKNLDSTFYGTDKHGIVDGQPKNFDTSMGYDNSSSAPNYILACTECHDPHGDLNGYNLRSEVSSRDHTKTKRGLLSYTWRYNDGGVVKKGADARFFCNGCHGRKHMGNNKSFPTDCFQGGTGCHSHGIKF